jgi:hypothetical protein
MRFNRLNIVSIILLIVLLVGMIVIPIYGLTPTLLGRISGSGAPNYLYGASDVFVSGSYAYVTAYFDDSFVVIDVSTPSSPTFVSKLSGSGSPNYLNGASSIYVVGNYAYVTSAIDDALTIIDISTPSSPTFVSKLSGSGAPNYLDQARNVFVSGNYAYVASWGYSALTIVDISTPATPTLSGVIRGSGSPNYLGGASSVFKSGNYAYVAASSDSSLTVIDVTNPAVPTFASKISGGGSPNYLQYPRSVFISGNFAYVSVDVDFTLTVIDITNPIVPSFEGYVYSSTYLKGVTDMYVSGNFAYITAVDSYCLAVVNISTPSSPIVDGGVVNGGIRSYQSGVFSVGDYTYVTESYGNALSIYDAVLKAPAITTTAASNITTASARLNSNLTEDGNDTCEVQFGYDTVSRAVFNDYANKTGLAGAWTQGQNPYVDISSLLMNTTYYFRAQVKNDYSTVTSSVELSFTTSSVPTVPTNLQAYPLSDSIYLTWTKGSGSNNTYIYYKTSPYTSSNTNLITNGSFETADPPTGWTLAGAGATFSRSSTQFKIGSYSGKLIRGGADCAVTQDLTTTENGETLTFGCWVYATVANRAYIYIADGTTTTTSIAHTGVAGWEWLEITQTINDGATHVYLGCQVKTGDTTAYFDRAFCIEGTVIPAEGTLVYSSSDSTYSHTGLTLGVTYYYALVGQSGDLFSDTYATILMTTTASGLTPTGFDSFTQPGGSDYDISNPNIAVLENLGPFYGLINGFIDSWGMARGNAWAGIAAFLIVIIALVVYIRSGSISGSLVVVLICLIITYFLKITSGWWIFFALAGVLGSFALPKREV